VSSLQEVTSWTLTHPILSFPTLALNDTRLNGYFASFDPLTTGPETLLDYPFGPLIWCSTR